MNRTPRLSIEKSQSILHVYWTYISDYSPSQLLFGMSRSVHPWKWTNFARGVLYDWPTWGMEWRSHFLIGKRWGYPKQRLKMRLVLVRIWFIVTILWSKFLIECQKLWGMFCSVTFILPSVRRLTPVAQRIRISHDQAMITRVFLSVKLLTCVYSEFSMTFWGNFFYSNWSIEYPCF